MDAEYVRAGQFATQANVCTETFQGLSRRAFLCSAAAAAAYVGLRRARALAAKTLSIPAQRSADHALVSAAVKLPGRGATLQGRLWRPAQDGRFPAVVLIHSSGRSDETLFAEARKIASAQIVVLVPDLLSCCGGDARLTKDQIAIDLRAGVDYLAAHPAVQPGNITVREYVAG